MHGSHQRHRWNRGRDRIHDIECGRSNHVEFHLLDKYQFDFQHVHIEHFHDDNDWLPVTACLRAQRHHPLAHTADLFRSHPQPTERTKDLLSPR